MLLSTPARVVYVKKRSTTMVVYEKLFGIVSDVIAL